MYDITSLAACGNAVFAGTLRSGIYLSTDNGTSWSAVNSGLTNNPASSFVFSLAVIGSNIFAGTGSGVFLSTNNGTSWSPANSGLPDNSSAGVLAAIGSTILARINGRLYLSTNNGTSWTAFNAGLPDSLHIYNMPPLAVSDSNIFAAINYNRIWRRPLSEISSVNIQKQQQELSKQQVTLKILSPSRSNHYVTIEFYLPNSQKVTARIYNLSGHEIASLVNENPGQGLGRFHWNTRNVAPGCYTIRMQAGSNIYTRSIPIFR